MRQCARRAFHDISLSDVQFVTLRESVEDSRSDARDTRYEDLNSGGGGGNSVKCVPSLEIPGRWRRHCPHGPIMSEPGCNLVSEGTAGQNGNTVSTGRCVCGPSVPWCPNEPRPYDYATRRECTLNLAAKMNYDYTESILNTTYEYYRHRQDTKDYTEREKHCHINVINEKAYHLCAIAGETRVYTVNWMIALNRRHNELSFSLLLVYCFGFISRGTLKSSIPAVHFSVEINLSFSPQRCDGVPWMPFSSANVDELLFQMTSLIPETRQATTLKLSRGPSCFPCLETEEGLESRNKNVNSLCSILLMVNSVMFNAAMVKMIGYQFYNLLKCSQASAPTGCISREGIPIYIIGGKRYIFVLFFKEDDCVYGVHACNIYLHSQVHTLYTSFMNSTNNSGFTQGRKSRPSVGSFPAGHLKCAIPDEKNWKENGESERFVIAVVSKDFARLPLVSNITCGTELFSAASETNHEITNDHIKNYITIEIASTVRHLLATNDEYIRHKEMEIFCVMTSTLVTRENSYRKENNLHIYLMLSTVAASTVNIVVGIDAVEGIALAIGEVGAKSPVSHLCASNHCNKLQ
ncbi:hypothetical protein WN51_13500 [Melipona quadrifasciata]|uniref:Uncharacterized protein n=1 Tax=Melipona quadrifasciata TaxID=166423 RepID=A0A0M8ZZ98_9HYME|nr:hypothetical protein WN51_13500 [Melipona quadrifasciata]